jgi:hypothetical protein
LHLGDYRLENRRVVCHELICQLEGAADKSFGTGSQLEGVADELVVAGRKPAGTWQGVVWRVIWDRFADQEDRPTNRPGGKGLE